MPKIGQHQNIGPAECGLRHQYQRFLIRNNRVLKYFNKNADWLHSYILSLYFLNNDILNQVKKQKKYLKKRGNTHHPLVAQEMQSH